MPLPAPGGRGRGTTGRRGSRQGRLAIAKLGRREARGLGGGGGVCGGWWVSGAGVVVWGRGGAGVGPRGRAGGGGGGAWGGGGLVGRAEGGAAGEVLSFEPPARTSRKGVVLYSGLII